MSTPIFSCEQARKLDMVDYLKALGHLPQKIRKEDYWYLSPLREERTASFKVNRKFNIWFDHGMGKGGNLLDFGVLYHKCSVRELLQQLAKKDELIFSFHPPLSPSKKEATKAGADEKEKIQIVQIGDLKSAALISYLNDRKIPVDIAKKYCKEVEFELYNRKHTAIGFKNNSGGFELRNKYFKGSSSPKDSTLINQNNATTIAVFEGFFSFLSYLVFVQKEEQKSEIPLPKLQYNYLILNSLSFFEKAKEVMEKHSCIHLYLDRDKAGIKATLNAILTGKQYHDQSHQYKQYKDLNEYLISQGYEHKQQLRQRRRL